MNHWHFQIAEFAKDHRVLIYDIRGHHKSELGTSPISIDLLAQDTIELLDSVFSKNEKAHFWGHSFGAPIALRVASMFPERVKSIVMVNGFYKNPFGDVLTNEMCLQILEGLAIFAKQAPKLSQWIWSSTTHNPLFHYIAGLTGGFNLERISYKDVEIYSKGLASMPLDHFFKNFEALIEFDATEYLEQTLAPVLIIHGSRDGLIPKHLNESLAKQLPNAEFSEFSEGSHCTQLDLPIDVNKRIRDFASNIS
jgi:pimeloyl-ACP methyl ester carboxylesterase